MDHKSVMNEAAKQQTLASFVKAKLDDMKVEARCGWKLILMSQYIPQNHSKPPCCKCNLKTSKERFAAGV